MTDSEHVGLSMGSGQGKSPAAAALLAQLALTGRPPDAPPPGPEWKPLPCAKGYQFSHRGKAKSVDRISPKNGRPYPGMPLKPRLDGDGYEVLNITYDNGERKNGVSLARCVLLAHAGEPPEPGMQACHGPGGQRDNRWPENIRWDDDQGNRDDRWEHHPPKPKPLKVCVLCGAGFDTPGRRCHPCVVELSLAAAGLIADGKEPGKDPEEAARELGYPSANGLFRLAKKYGGLRCTVGPVVVVEEVNAALREASRTGHSPSWLQRVIGGRIKRGDAP